MASPADNLQTAINGYAATLAAEAASPKPSYNVDGQQVQWTEYQTFLIEKMEQLIQLQIRLSGPYEVRSQGTT